MSPVPTTDSETEEETRGGYSTAMAPVTPTTPSVVTPEPAYGGGEVPAPAPTKVDAYRPRGIRSKRDPLGVSHVVLRSLTLIFSLIAFATIASNSGTVQIQNIFYSVRFSDFFYFSYLLTVNVITFAYAIVTLGLTIVLLVKSLKVGQHFFIGMFVMDQILSYLLMSASSSAATGIRAQHTFLVNNLSNSFYSTSYAAIAFSFLAFFALALASLLSGLRVARIGRE